VIHCNLLLSERYLNKNFIPKITGQPNSAKVTYIVSLREEREIRNGAQQDPMKYYSWL
jgi:hypothetical protein